VRVEYSKDVDAAYLYLVDEIKAGGVAKTYPLDPRLGFMINLDFDSGGHLVGIEVLDASHLLPRSLLDSAEVTPGPARTSR
jgi:uncharacterized protein YuzE